MTQSFRTHIHDAFIRTHIHHALIWTHIHGALFQTHIHGAFYSEAHSQYAHFQTHIYEAIFRTNLFGLTYLFRLTFMMHLKDSYSWRNLFKTRIQNALILTQIWDVLIWTKYSVRTKMEHIHRTYLVTVLMKCVNMSTEREPFSMQLISLHFPTWVR